MPVCDDGGICVLLCTRCKEYTTMHFMRRSYKAPCALLGGSMTTGGSGLLSAVQRRFMQDAHFQPGNRYVSSTGVHSSFMTACGRRFDPNLHQEVIEATSDQKWVTALYRALQEDVEYSTMLRDEGGVAPTVKAIAKGVTHDEEFMIKLRHHLQTDRKVSLSLCAMQEAYSRIRSRRDENQTRVAAGGRNPYDALKQTSLSFGQLPAPR